MESIMATSTIEASKEKLLEDFNALIAEAEQLLKSVASEGGDKANSLRVKMEENLRAAKSRLKDVEGAVVEKTRAAAHATDDYVHDHPWQAIGVAAGIGVVIGLLLNRR
jgi:ElaB/YqjD/DUF883 family membrane-anchored ribosome-binding protein